MVDDELGRKQGRDEEEDDNDGRPYVRIHVSDYCETDSYFLAGQAKNEKVTFCVSSPLIHPHPSHTHTHTYKCNALLLMLKDRFFSFPADICSTAAQITIF